MLLLPCAGRGALAAGNAEAENRSWKIKAHAVSGLDRHRCPRHRYRHWRGRGPNVANNPPALDRIIGNFRTKEFRFWNSELRIVGVENIQQVDFLPWAAQSIPRRFCSGVAVINDGGRTPIYYSIAEDTGMIGMDWGVNFCVVGLDRDWAYNPACRAARP